MLRQAQQPLTTHQANGLEIALFPWEDAATYVADIEAYLAETEAKPDLGIEYEPEMTRYWSGIKPAEQKEFYHDHGCTCPRCEKAHTCQTQVHGVGAGAIAYRITTPAGKQYMPVVNIHSRVITCNCPNGQHLYRATCYHAQAAWLNYLTMDRRSALS